MKGETQPLTFEVPAGSEDLLAFTFRDQKLRLLIKRDVPFAHGGKGVHISVSDEQGSVELGFSPVCCRLISQEGLIIKN